MTCLEEGRVCLGEPFEGRCRGELYRLTVELTSSKTVVKDFPYTLKVTSTDSFKSIA